MYVPSFSDFESLVKPKMTVCLVSDQTGLLHQSFWFCQHLQWYGLFIQFAPYNCRNNKVSPVLSIHCTSQRRKTADSRHSYLQVGNLEYNRSNKARPTQHGSIITIVPVCFILLELSTTYKVPSKSLGRHILLLFCLDLCHMPNGCST